MVKRYSPAFINSPFVISFHPSHASSHPSPLPAEARSAQTRDVFDGITSRSHLRLPVFLLSYREYGTSESQCKLLASRSQRGTTHRALGTMQFSSYQTSRLRYGPVRRPL